MDELFASIQQDLAGLADRLAAVEARLPWVGTAADVAPQVVPSTTADDLSPVEPAPQAPQGVTVEELSGILYRELPATPVDAHPWYEYEAAWLLAHPRLGPLLRGEVARQQGGQADG